MDEVKNSLPITEVTDLNEITATANYIFKPPEPEIVIPVKNAKNYLQEAFNKLSILLNSAKRGLIEGFYIATYHDSKIKHLALHSKKARVRKKNRNRILKERGYK